MKRWQYIIIAIGIIVLMETRKIIASPVVLSKVNEYFSLISSTAASFALPVDLLQALVCVESAGNPQAVSNKGAIGLTQVMPTTLEDINVMLGSAYFPEDLYTPEISMLCGAKYLSYLFSQTNDITQALRAYNAGPKALEQNPNVSQDYVDRINAYRKLIAEGS